MTLNKYQELAMRTANQLNNGQLVVNGAMGMNGESGEVIDIVKKHLFQGHDLNKDDLCEEAGDVLWYIATFISGLGMTLQECAERNIKKLKKRYPEGFESEKSTNREEYIQ